MAKNKYKAEKRKYSSSQKKAYYMGYGAGMSKDEAVFDTLTDERQGLGQRSDLCESARKGYLEGKKNRYGNPFAVGYKKYPVSTKRLLDDERKHK